MQHCQQAIYVTDNHCADCGEQLKEKPQLLSVEDIHPGILDDLKNIAPDAQLLTGIIKSMFYYKRRYKNSNDNMFYGFWWLEVEDTKGVIHHFNIDAEPEILADLKKGTAITVFHPGAMILTHKIAAKDAKQRVTNDDFYPIVIAHYDKKQHRSWHESINKDFQSSYFLWFLISLIMMVGLLFFTELEFLHATFITLPVLIGVLLMEISNNKKNKVKTHTRYDHATKIADKILDTTKRQLGYNMLSRLHNSADIVCIGCQKRISSDAHYCYDCGEKQPTHIEDTKDSIAPLSRCDQQISEVIKPTTIAEFEAKLMSEFSTEYTKNYTHRNVLGRNESGKIIHQAILGKVIDKSQQAKSSQSERAVTRTETTNIYRGGMHVDTSERSTTEIYRNRNTSMRGQITLSTANAEPYVFNADEDIIGSVDLGDWIFYAYSDIDTTRYHSYYREYCHNLTKQLDYHTRSVTEFSMTKGIGWTITLGIVAVGCTAYFTPRDYSSFIAEFIPRTAITQLEKTPILIDNLHFLPVILFSIFVLTAAFLASGYAMINSSRLTRSVSKLKKTIAKFRKEYDTITDRINKFN